MRKRHVYMDLACVMCNYQTESILHLLTDCPFAKYACTASHLGILLRGSSLVSFLDWVIKVAALLHTAHFKSVMIICWAIWRARNRKLRNEQGELPDVVVAQTLHWWLSFITVNGDIRQSNPSLRIAPKWATPPSGQLK